MSLLSDLCSASGTAVLYAKSCYIGRRYKDIRLYYRKHMNICRYQTAVLRKYGILALTQMRENDLLHLFRVTMIKSLLLLLQYWCNYWKLLVPTRCSDNMIHDLWVEWPREYIFQNEFFLLSARTNSIKLKRWVSYTERLCTHVCNSHNRQPGRFYCRF